MFKSVGVAAERLFSFLKLSIIYFLDTFDEETIMQINSNNTTLETGGISIPAPRTSGVCFGSQGQLVIWSNFKWKAQLPASRFRTYRDLKLHMQGSISTALPYHEDTSFSISNYFYSTQVRKVT